MRGRYLLTCAGASSVALLLIPFATATSPGRVGAGTASATDAPITFPAIRSPDMSPRVSAKAKTVVIAGKGGATAAKSKVVGGKGARKFVVKNNAKGYWTITGDGKDTLDLSAVLKKVKLNLGGTKHQKVFTGLRIRLKDKFSLVRGGAKRDIIQGGKSAEKIEGRAGNDVLKGGGGADKLLGSLGNDILEGGGGNDTLDSGPSTAREFSYGGAGKD